MDKSVTGVDAETGELFEGSYMFGVCEGFSQTAWRSDATKFNYEIGISRSYEDSFGNMSKNITRVSVPRDEWQRYRDDATEMKGHRVCIRVHFTARTGGRDGAWLSCYAPKNSYLQRLD